MTMIGFEHYSPPPAISVSTLVSFSRCPRKFFYSFGVGIGKEEHIALKFGEAIHAALPQAFFSDLEGSLKSFDAVWQDRTGDDKRNKLNAMQMLVDFRDSHINGRSIYTLTKPPLGTLRGSDQISDYEIPFVLDIGLPIPLVGRIDASALHRDTHEPWGIEYKTSSEMSTRFFDGFQFNPQVVCYTLALRSMGIPVKGMIVEGIKVSSAKKDAHGTQSIPIFVTDQMIEDFLLWTRYTAHNMLAMQEAGNFLKDLSACTPYPQHGSAGYQCEYLPLCLTSDWTRMKEMYVKTSYPTFKLLATASPAGREGGAVSTASETPGEAMPPLPNWLPPSHLQPAEHQPAEHQPAEHQPLTEVTIHGHPRDLPRDRSKDPSRTIRIGPPTNPTGIVSPTNPFDTYLSLIHLGSQTGHGNASSGDAGAGLQSRQQA